MKTSLLPIALPKSFLKIQKHFCYSLYKACHFISTLTQHDFSQINPRENTARCYRFLHYLTHNTGAMSDYTEGYYEKGDESYEEAQQLQLNFILDKAGVKKGLKLLELGCGNGRLLKMAQARGAIASGITISPEQVRSNTEKGLTTYLVDFKDLSKSSHFSKNEFDVVVANGSVEHFVTEFDALKNRQTTIYRNLFKNVHRVLKPGGRFFITCIHFRQPPLVREALKDPWLFPFGSEKFQRSILLKFFSGWYPHDDMLEKCAYPFFKKKYEYDATWHYQQTSIEWENRVLQSLLKPTNYPTMVYGFVDAFLNDPKYFSTILTYTLSRAWLWQFLEQSKQSSPMVHKWLLFKKTS